jgi:hypothetical protein
MEGPKEKSSGSLREAVFYLTLAAALGGVIVLFFLCTRV